LVITAVGLDPAGTISPANCAITFTPQSNLSVPIGANNATATFTLTGAVAMGTTADDSCAGQTITIPITLTGSTPTPTSAQFLETYSPAVPNEYLSLAAGSGWGQTIARPAGVSKLSKVDVYVNANPNNASTPTAATTLTVWPGAPGVGTAIASQSFNVEYVNGQWTSFSLSSPVDVPATFSVTFEQATYSGFYGLSASSSNPYAGGTAYWKNGSYQPWSNANHGNYDLQLRLFGF
jgi:hypothetical protein